LIGTGDVEILVSYPKGRRPERIDPIAVTAMDLRYLGKVEIPKSELELGDILAKEGIMIIEKSAVSPNHITIKPM
jgi:hypothetical protein